MRISTTRHGEMDQVCFRVECPIGIGLLAHTQAYNKYCTIDIMIFIVRLLLVANAANVK